MVASRSSRRLPAGPGSQSAGTSCEAVQGEAGREEPLDHQVVQIPGDAVAVRQDRAGCTVLLCLSTVDSKCCLGGEPAESRQVIVVPHARTGFVVTADEEGPPAPLGPVK